MSVYPEMTVLEEPTELYAIVAGLANPRSIKDAEQSSSRASFYYNLFVKCVHY